MHRPHRIVRYLRSHRHSALLTAIILAFAVRPIIGEGDIAPVIFSVAMLVLLLVAVLTIQVDELIGDRERLFAQHRRISIIGWALAIPRHP